VLDGLVQGCDGFLNIVRIDGLNGDIEGRYELSMRGSPVRPAFSELPGWVTGWRLCRYRDYHHQLALLWTALISPECRVLGSNRHDGEDRLIEP
jgi:hypothetical protein